jgi:hypothetical protein
MFILRTMETARFVDDVDAACTFGIKQIDLL